MQISSTDPYLTSALTATTSVSSSASTDSPSTTAPTDAGSGTPKSGDGPIITAMRDAMESAGVGASQPGVGKHEELERRHAFAHALFGALHDQKESDRSAGGVDTTGGAGDTSQALTELANAAAAGNAPPDLQAAFDALQTPGTSSGGSSSDGSGQGSSNPGTGSNSDPASLASVLQSMAAQLAGVPGQSGNVVDTLA
jgi:hypothetical protein